MIGAPENRLPENLQLPLYYLQKKFKPRSALPEFSTNTIFFSIICLILILIYPNYVSFKARSFQIKSEDILKLNHVLLEIEPYYEVSYCVKKYHSKLLSFLENCLLIYIICLALCMYNVCQPIFHRH